MLTTQHYIIQINDNKSIYLLISPQLPRIHFIIEVFDEIVFYLTNYYYFIIMLPQLDIRERGNLHIQKKPGIGLSSASITLSIIGAPFNCFQEETSNVRIFLIETFIFEQFEKAV